LEKSALIKFRKCILLLLLVMAVAFGVLTAIRQNRPGTIFENAFLSYSKKGETGVYSGTVHGDLVTITVTPNGTSTDVFIQVEGELDLPCRVEYPEGTVAFMGVSFPKLEIFRNEELIFQGGYDPEPLRFATYLRDSEGKPYRETGNNVASWPDDSFSAGYIYFFAKQYTNAVQGSWAIWAMMVLFSCIVAVDLFVPLYTIFLHRSTNKDVSCSSLILRRGLMFTLLLLGYVSGVQIIDYF